MESGRITREQADEAYNALRKRMLEGAVKSGKISREQANERYRALRERTPDGKDDKRESAKAPSRGDWESIKRRIEAGVKSGRMTREEADAKYKEIRKQMAERRDR